MQVVQRSYRVNETVVAAELDSEMVLLNVETGIYFGLDEIGTTIWSMLVANHAEESIVEELMSQYEIDEEQLHADVHEFLESLRSNELVFLEDC